MMAEIKVTKDVYLWSISVIYLVAFTSLFLQIPGLFGKDGILPAELVLLEEPDSLSSFHKQPSLLRFASRCGIDAQTGMEILCLAGIFLSFIASIRRAWRHSLTYLTLWFFYLSLFHVGQVFLFFQWDILLLEAGLLTVLIAPISWNEKLSGWFHAKDGIAFWSLKWLLFRLLFASGVVKLTSRCPEWWGLTVSSTSDIQPHQLFVIHCNRKLLKIHNDLIFAMIRGECIPTPVAWYLYQAPLWFHKVCLVITFVIQLLIPFLFFSPVRSHRKFAFYCQVVLMSAIILSGNYYFFNWLTIALCLSLINDDQISEWVTGKCSEKKSCFLTFVRWVANAVVGGGLVYSIHHLFSFKLSANISSPIDANFAINVDKFEHYLVYAVPLTIAIAVASLVFCILRSIFSALKNEMGACKKLSNVFGCLVVGLAVVFIFCVSLVSYSRIEKNVQNEIPEHFKEWNHMTASSFRLTSSYGLFKRMTGVEGRPEVIIEGSNSEKGKWLEYHFRYKPGDVNQILPFVAPHHPRLDWQMWFAALGKYQQQPWFLNLVYRLLKNQPEVLHLMDKNPFQNSPPKFIQATLYHYHFTSSNQSSDRYSKDGWWTREKVRQYLPPLSLTHPTLVSHVQKSLDASKEKSVHSCKCVEYVRLATRFLQTWLSSFNGFTVCVSMVVTSLAIVSSRPILNFLKESA